MCVIKRTHEHSRPQRPRSFWSTHEINGMAKSRYLAHLHRSTISVDDRENVSRQWGKVKLWKNTPKDFKLKAKAKYSKARSKRRSTHVPNLTGE